MSKHEIQLSGSYGVPKLLAMSEAGPRRSS